MVWDKTKNGNTMKWWSSTGMNACGIPWRRQQVANDSYFMFFFFVSHFWISGATNFIQCCYSYGGKTTHQKSNDLKRTQIKISKSNIKIIIKNNSASNNSHEKGIGKPRDSVERWMSAEEGLNREQITFEWSKASFFHPFPSLINVCIQPTERFATNRKNTAVSPINCLCIEHNQWLCVRARFRKYLSRYY